ncbi:hypothetical protein LDO32_17860 [Luteimonas sp. Y-2-2-4F]|nr:hypothetical protein [Luteimonas sp. Y-2-2-4F]MCD9033582.1 hypothetical protein [Luteimonas sp. Y-2-2-4F]
MSGIGREPGLSGLVATRIAMTVPGAMSAPLRATSPTDDHFREAPIAGTMMRFHGLSAAMLAHPCNGAPTRLRESSRFL